MLITEVTPGHIPQWLALAAEMEPLFQGSMVNNPEFQVYMRAKIEHHEVFTVVDHTAQTVVGVIGFSCTHNRISWLGVFEQYRKHGAGSKLLLCALNQLDPVRAVTVCTFRDGEPGGQPTYLFVVPSGNGCIMTRVPDEATRHGGNSWPQSRSITRQPEGD